MASTKESFASTRDAVKDVTKSVASLGLTNNKRYHPQQQPQQEQQQLAEVAAKLETLTQTVLFMEKRLSLVEEQVKLLTTDKLN